MKTFTLLTPLLVLVVAAPAVAQRVTVSSGEVSARVDPSRLSTRIPGVDPALQARLRVSGDSAQRIAMRDFEWKGRVSSLEIDEADALLFWDVKIVPDSVPQTIVRYRVDAMSGGILSIKEFTGVRGLVVRKP